MMKHFHFDTLTSTNDYLKEHAHELPDLCYVTATNQTNGKGRNQRVWLNEPQSSLALSIFIQHPKLEMNQYSILIALSIIEMLQKYHIKAMIKWPNDIVIDKKKICGILLEGRYDTYQNFLIIGVGININNQNFADAISKKATSMFLQTNTIYSLKEVEKNLIKYFKKNLKKSLQYFNNQMQTYKNYSCVLNQIITFDYGNSKKTGQVKEILDDGSLLIVDEENHEIKINYGEVTLQNLYD